MNIRLIKTCDACPEQYDAVLDDGTQVGYLRLRHGYFSVSCPGVSGITVYDAYTFGDGCFNDEEREKHLRKAVKKIKRYLNESQRIY